LASNGTETAFLREKALIVGIDVPFGVSDVADRRANTYDASDSARLRARTMRQEDRYVAYRRTNAEV
jgi:hypothetical protein